MFVRVTNKKGEIKGFENVKINNHLVNLFECRQSHFIGASVWYKVIVTDLNQEIIAKKTFHSFDILEIFKFMVHI